MIISNIWQEFLKIVNEEAGSRVVETWFKAVSLFQWDSYRKTIYLKAPNTFVKDWIQVNYINLLQTHLCRLLNETRITIIFLDGVQPEPDAKKNRQDSNDNIEIIGAAQSTKKALVISKTALPAKHSINSNFQFDSFVVGPNNSLAYAAAQAVAEKPGMLYNPLFIYGGSGLGKTHLLHAVGNRIKTENSKMRIVYQSADRFVNEFINAIRFDKVPLFENKYKDIDVLLIDDIQFISNKEQTQEAFFHIFNTLYEARKQIVFSSDSLPCDIAGLAERLRSRLDGGLITDIQAPTLETKIAILQKKADIHKEPLQDDVAHFIASRVQSNVRELEGLLIRVLAFATITHQAVSLELAHKVLARSTKEVTRQATLDLPQIANSVARYYNYSLQELRSTNRQKGITHARHVAMYFMKKLTEKSLSDIGSFWCRKDHSTVIHAIDKINELKQNDTHFDSELKKLEQLLTQ